MPDNQDSGIDGHPSRKMEGQTAETAKKIPWLMELRAFCSDASVVGLRYVANQSASMFRRSVWVLLLIVGASFTTYQILDRITYYFSYPTVVNIRVQHAAEMLFPTVTVCNENFITLSGATSLSKMSLIILCEFVTRSEIQKNSHHLTYGIKFAFDVSQVLFVFNPDYTEMVMQMFQPYGETSFSPNFTGYDFRSIDWYKTYEAMAQSPDDAIAAVCNSV